MFNPFYYVDFLLHLEKYPLIISSNIKHCVSGSKDDELTSSPNSSPLTNVGG